MEKKEPKHGLIFGEITSALEKNDLSTLRNLLKNHDIMGWTALHFAVEHQNLPLTEQILHEKDAINVVDKFNRTPLSIAAYKNNLDLIKLLIKYDANPNAGFPLHCACEKGDVSCIKYLIEQGSDVNTKNHLGYYPILITVAKNHMDATKLLIELGVDLSVFDSTEKATVLHLACHNNNLEIVKLLLNAGAPIKVEDKYSTTPLSTAVLNTPDKKTCLDLVKLLLANGANQYQNLLHNASSPEIINELLKHGAQTDELNDQGETALFFHSYANNIKSVRVMLQYSHVDEQKTYGGWSPLHIAAYQGNFKIVEELIVKFKANVNLASACNVIPLHLAAVRGHLKIARILVENGSLIDVPFTRLYDFKCHKLPHFLENQWFIEGATPLFLATKEKHFDLCRLLQEKEAPTLKIKDWPCDVLIESIRSNAFDTSQYIDIAEVSKSRDLIGWTCLHHSVASGSLEITSFLLQKGFDVDVKDNYERTPSTIAAFKNNLAILKLLLDNGADVNSGFALNAATQAGSNDCISALARRRGCDLNLSDYPPLMQACYDQRPETVRCLLENGANPNCVNKRCCEETPIFYALQNNDYESVRLLIEYGADVNYSGIKTQNTPLMEAALFAKTADGLKSVQLLLEEGADVNARDQFLSTVLHNYVQTSSESGIDCLLELIKAGAEINPKNDDEETPLMLASDLATVKILIENGADVNVSTTGGYTVTHHFTEEDGPEILQELLKNDANVNAAAFNNVLPIHIAAKINCVEKVQELIDHGSYIDAPVFDLPSHGYQNAALKQFRKKFKVGDTPVKCAAQDTVQLLNLYEHKV